MELSDYIKVFDNVVPEAICKNLISTYENSNPEFVNNEGRPKFHHLSLDPEMSKFLLENLRQCLSDYACLLYTSPSPRDRTRSRMPSSA